MTSGAIDTSPLPVVPFSLAQAFFSKESRWRQAAAGRTGGVSHGAYGADDDSCLYSLQALNQGFVVAGALNKGGDCLRFDIALAYSGGLDSRLLATLLKKDGRAPLLFHIFGLHSILGEGLHAVRWAYENGFCVVCLPMDPLTIPDVRANGKRRCYHCKHAMFTLISQVSRREQFVQGEPVIQGERVTWQKQCTHDLLLDLPCFNNSRNRPQELLMCDGTLASDMLTYRPGLQALREKGIVSPLALAGFDKERVSRVARQIGLERPEQASQSCLLTRFGYGVPLKEAQVSDLGVADALVKAFWEDYCQVKGLGVVFHSLRLPDAQTLEWHIEGVPPSQEAGERLAREVRREAPSLPPMRIRQVERVKGFFDRGLL